MTQTYLAEVRAALAGVRRRWVAARLMRAVARLVTGVCLSLLVVLVIDLILALPDIPMLLLAAGAVAAAAVFAVRVLWPLRVQPTDRRVARFVEERCPELEDRVASAAELGDTGTPTAFHDLVVADAAERLRRLDLGRVVTSAHLRLSAMRGVLATAVLIAILTLGMGPISRVARTAWLYALPFSVTLEVEPGDVQIMAGQPLRVRARLSGAGRAPTRTLPTLTVLDGQIPRVVEMRATSDGYVAELPSVTDSLVYHVSAATLTSPDYRVEALVTPRVRQIDVHYVYPPFTGLAPHIEEDGGDIYAPAGTEVTLLVHIDKAVAEGTLVLSDGGRVPLDGAGAGPLTAVFPVETDGSYTVAVTDVDGLSNPGDTEYFIRTTFDRVPEVRVLRPGGDREITPLEEVTIEVRADDDYRVDALELVYTVVGQRERSMAFETPSRARTVTGSGMLYAEDLGVTPGDFITFYARARDVGYAGQSREVRSDIFFLEVRPFDNEFEEAQSQAGMGRDAEDVSDLAAVQKEIIVATWRLDEANPAAVADDIRAVGEVQGELRDAAARVAERVLGRGREFSAGDTGQAPENEAMARAVDAMTEAQQTLALLSTDMSLPHEMEALNQLLTAQVAIRRQQAAMQQGQGSGTPGTQAQEDLSALFDRELRREQETNYEIGTSPNDQRAEDDDESEARRRLRELAERQAALNRELAGLEEDEPGDALRRTLERLTREQQALREQLEELTDQLARQQQAAGQTQGQQSGTPGDAAAGGSDDMRRIAQQMRRAMSELRRQDPRNARVSGDQALEEMRRLEQRLRGESAGQLRRATGRDDEAQRLAAQMEEAQELRQRLEQLQRQLDGQQRPQASQAARASSERPGGSREGGGEPGRLRREYVERLEHSPGLLDALRRQSPELDRDLEQWAQHWQSMSAPGTEAFKQDFENWDSLRRNLENALQQFAVDRSRELAVGERRDRPSAGPEEPLPERYRRLVDQYYRSLATAPGSP